MAFPEAAKAVGARRIEDLKDFVSQCDVITVNAPLHEGTRNLINAELLSHFKKVSRSSFALKYQSLTFSLRVHGS